MPHRLSLALLVAAAALAATTPAAHGAFTADARPGRASFAAAEHFPPRNVVRPAVSGTPREGEILTGTAGTWARTVDATSGTWLRDGTPVGTGATRVLEAADVGHRLVYRVTATNAGGSSTADSVATAIIIPALPRNTTRPAISGTATVGSVLTANDGAWSGSPTGFVYRWIRCAAGTCRDIQGATEPSLLLTGEDAGATVTLGVTATNDGGSVEALSIATHTIARATYAHVVCRNPDDGAHLGEDGALPAGFSFTRSVSAFPNPAAATRCASGDGVPLSTGGTWSTATRDAGGRLEYRTVDDVELAGATLYRQGATSGNFAWTIGTGATAPAEACSSAAGCSARGSLLDPFAAANRVDVDPGPDAADTFELALVCDPPAGGGTCTADGTQTLRLLGAKVALRDVATPQVTTAATGGLATDPVLEGIEDLAFAATDAGAGLYRVRVRVGTEEVDTSALRADPGRCADVDPGDGDPYEFDARRPCPLALAADLRFDTETWPRTGRLRVLLEDAGRNSTLLVSRDLGGLG